MLKAKMLICPQCRRVIRYSPAQAGTKVPCPSCGSPANLPPASDRPAAPAARNKGARLFWLLPLLVLAAAGTCLLLKGSIKSGSPLKRLSAVCVFMSERSTLAPEPARVRGTQTTVAVTDVYYGCPDIYQAALNKTSSTDTPVCCVKLTITNAGTTRVGYRTWRDAATSAEQNWATLTGADGLAHGLVSYGPDTYPSGTRRQMDIAPGESATDLILFICAAKPAGELKLTLPCENLGGKGVLRFTIPRDMIR